MRMRWCLLSTLLFLLIEGQLITRSGRGTIRRRPVRASDSEASSPTIVRSPSPDRRLVVKAEAATRTDNWKKPLFRNPSTSSSEGESIRNYVAVASVKAEAAKSTFTKTADHPDKKMTYDHTVNHAVDHLVSAAAGGQSTRGIQVTAQGLRTSVTMDLFDGATGYVQPFYDRKPSTRLDFDWKNSPGKLEFGPDSSGKRMGVVAEVKGEGYLKAKGSNREKRPTMLQSG